MTQSVRSAGVTTTLEIILMILSMCRGAKITQIRYDFGKILIDVELFEDLRILQDKNSVFRRYNSNF